MKSMKRMTAALLAALTLAGAAATTCAFAENTQPAAEMTGMANPWVELDSLEALNEAAEVNLQLPGVMGITDVTYRLMTTGEYPLAELCFKVNGMAYTLRASGDMENDISGVYTADGETAFANADYPAYAATDEVKLARWANISGQYVLMAEDAGEMDEATFLDIADEMVQVTNPNPIAELPEGTYYDSVSQRAVAEVKALGDYRYAIEVHWANSASEDTVWTMTAEATEDGLLNYTDCVKKLVTTAEDGTQTEAVANLIPDGYFELADGKLLWTGAAEPECTECVFELAAE